jgi:hypothetical protein
MQCPVPYAQDCVLLRAVARTLHLPPSASCTALVLLHQGRHSDDPWSLTPEVCDLHTSRHMALVGL